MHHDKITSGQQSLCLLLLPFALFACGGGNGGGGDSNADTTAPSVSATSPTKDATEVARNSNLTATFDEDIFAVTVDATSFTLTKTGANTIVAGNVTFDGASNVVSLTPDAPLAFFANYTATLTTAITDLSGNPLDNNVSWSFTTVARNWGSPALIESDDAGDAFNPKIAVDGSGNALVVWRQSDGTRFNIWANRFDGRNWGSATLIENDNAGNASGPQIAFNSSDSGLTVWRQYDGTRNSIWSNRFDGTSWGSAELIESDNAGDAFNPQIAVDRSGNALAVWRQSDGARNNIWANRFDGASWGSAELIESDNTGDASNPQIAFDSSGNAFAVWQQSDGTRFNIWTNRFNGTSWASAALIESEDAGDAFSPQIAFDSSGNAFAVWYQSDGIVRNIWVNRFDGNSWGSATLIENGAGHASSPQITFDSSGNALAVWQQFDGARNNIWANRFDGSSWGSARLIERDNAGNASSPQIVFDSSGNALAVWQQSDGTLSSVWSNRFDGSSWGSAERVEDNDAGGTSSPQVAVDNSGNALLAVWPQFDGIRFNIWANRFE